MNPTLNVNSGLNYVPDNFKISSFADNNHWVNILLILFVWKKIIIEVDGSQPNEPDNAKHDLHRTKYFEDEGYMVLRFWNNDILTNIEGVGLKLLEQINLLIWNTFKVTELNWEAT